VRGAHNMERLDGILSMLERTLNSKKKRHIAGGILMSVSLLFCGLTFTVMTIRTEDNTNEQYLE
jgi:hypothetical protein